MKMVFFGAAALSGLFVLALITAFVFVASPPPPMPAPTDVFGFASLRKLLTEIDPPDLRRFRARDGEELAYRIYPSTADRVLIFIHGSSYHGGGYHALASFLSLSGAAKVVLPNLRGHYQSGRHRGDIEYIGQLEDDLDDLIRFLRAEHLDGPITLGGHSSGGGLVIRFAGGAYGGEVSSYLPLAPVIPGSAAVKGTTSGGWASLHWRRLYGLLALNAIGIHGFDGLPIIEFNKPAKYWDGTETLSYSYRLNVSYHPRFRYQDDVRALDNRSLVLVGTDDEAIDAEGLRAVIAASAPNAKMTILPNINHFGIFSDPAALDTIAAWLKALPPGADAGR